MQGSLMQTTFVGSTTDEPRRPPPVLAEVSQVEAISNAVMVQMTGIMTAFQAQISYLSAKVNLGSSALTPWACSSVARATLVKPDTGTCWRTVPSKLQLPQSSTNLQALRVTERGPHVWNICHSLALSPFMHIMVLCPWSPRCL